MPLSPEPLAIITGSFLSLGRRLAWASAMLTLLGLGVVAVNAPTEAGGLVWVLAASVGLGFLQGYWALRVELDAQLFALLAKGKLDGRDIDHFRAELLAGKASPLKARTMHERSHGALQLLKRQAVTLLLQSAMLLVGLVGAALAS